MNRPRYRYLFGPVASRRLGRSLGVDLTTGRQCCFDCVFCETGRTRELTVARHACVPVDAVIVELRAWLAAGGTADVITLAGSGEPTLHTEFGAVIDAVHAACSIPVALLTNGALLSDPAVRAAAARAELVKVSLSAWDEASLVALNRPAEGLHFTTLIAGLRAFSAVYRGRLWVETILVRGINDAPEQIARIAALAGDLNPEKVQLNTVVRPPAIAGTEAVPPAELQRLATRFTPQAEVIGMSPATTGGAAVGPDAETLVAILERRPCTVEDLATGLGLEADAVRALLDGLPAAAGIRRDVQDGRVYYRSGASLIVCNDPRNLVSRVKKVE